MYLCPYEKEICSEVTSFQMHRRGGSVVERSLHIREIGVQSQVDTDLNR